MKSLKDDETRKINLDDIMEERRIVEDEILTIRMMKKSVPLMQRLVLLGARLIKHGEEEYVNQLSKEYPLPDITALVEKYSDDKYGEKRIKELKRGAVTKVEKPKVIPRSPEPIQKKTAILLSHGKIVADGSAETILRDKALLEANRMELPFCLQGRHK